MKILVLTEYFPIGPEPIFTGGVEARVFHLVKFLSRRHEVEVVRRTAKYSFNSLAAVVGRAAFFASQLIKITFCTRKYDIVEGTNFVTYILAFLYAKRTGAKAAAWYPDVFIGHGVERLGLASGIVTEVAERLAVRLPWDGVIALSGETKKKLIKAGVEGKKIEIIYGGVENRKQKTENTRLPARQGKQKFGTPTILCISRLVKYKRIQDLLLAIYFLKEKFAEIQAIIVGGGPEKSKLKVKSEKLKVANRVKFLSGITEREKWELLARSHIHVLPSVVEGFGLATVEALAAGTPVVNVDIPINREILQKEEGRRKKEEGSIRGGLLFSAGDSVDLAEKIEMLLTDRKLYNQKVSEGKELVKRYEWEKVNRQAEEFYQRLLSD